MMCVQQPIYWFNTPSAPSQRVRNWCILVREYIQSVRRPVSSWEFASRLRLPVSSRVFASRCKLPVSPREFASPTTCACLLGGICKPLWRGVANVRRLSSSRRTAAGIIRWDLPASCGRFRQDRGVSPVVHRSMLASVCIPIGLDDAASVRMVALPAAVVAFPLVESTAQPGSVTQRIGMLPALRLLWLGLGASSRARLALGLRPCATRRPCLPDLRRGQLPHRFACL